MTIKTHYDNLKVARNAPDEVIRAAYRSLSEKYHPGRHPGSAEAARIRKILDAAYDTLTDPVRRKEHDQWIERQELGDAEFSESLTTSHRSLEGLVKNVMSPLIAWASVNRSRLWMGAGLVVATVLFVSAEQGGLFASSNESAPRLSKPYNPAPAPDPMPAPALVQPRDKTVPVRSPPMVPINSVPTSRLAPVALKPACEPSASPKGYQWPDTAGYLKGYPKRAMTGRSIVRIDNSQSGDDVMVKLVSTSDSVSSPVRVFYIPAHGDFTASKLSSGTYDVRFCTISDGHLSRSDPFTLEEIHEGNVIEATRFDLTLYTVPHGNTQMHALNPADF